MNEEKNKMHGVRAACLQALHKTKQKGPYPDYREGKTTAPFNKEVEPYINDKKAVLETNRILVSILWQH